MNNNNYGVYVLYIIYIGRMSSYLVLSILGRSSLLGILNLYIYTACIWDISLKKKMQESCFGFGDDVFD